MGKDIRQFGRVRCGIDQRQRREPPRNPHLLPGGPEGDAAFPVEPVSAGAAGAAATPGLAFVESGEEPQQPVGGGGDLAGQECDLLAEAFVELAVVKLGQGNVCSHCEASEYCQNVQSILPVASRLTQQVA